MRASFFFLVLNFPHLTSLLFTSTLLSSFLITKSIPKLRHFFLFFLYSIPELRQVTTLFLRLDSYHPEESQDPVSLQPLFYLLQQILADTGGFLRQFLVDDKVSGKEMRRVWNIYIYVYIFKNIFLYRHIYICLYRNIFYELKSFFCIYYYIYTHHDIFSTLIGLSYSISL